MLYLIRFLANFMVFCMYLLVLQLHDRAKYQKPWIDSLFWMLLLNSYWASKLRRVKEKKWHWDSKIYFFCVVPLSLKAKYEFWYFETGLFATCTPPIMHLKLPPKILHNLCFSFLLGITAVPREIDNHSDAKFWGTNKMHYGKCIMGIHCRHTHTIQEGHFFRTNFKLKRTLIFHYIAHCFFLFLRNFPLQMKNLMLTEMERFVEKPLICG